VTCGWGGEAALDLQWTHAIAPFAKLVLVEAKSDALDDLFAAVQTAVSYIGTLGQGRGQISMSWGTDEWDSETTYDRYFPDGPIYFASSGDKGGVVIYPSASPRVVAVGGTSFTRDNTGQLVSITGWSGSGGGISRFETKPSFQNGVENLHGANRNVPDISADADPQSGVAVWLTTVCGGQQAGWQVIGGTSLASPMVAAMANISHHLRTSGTSESISIYGNRPAISTKQRIRDVVGGDPAGGNEALVGYDNVTGVGEPLGLHFDDAPATP